MFSPSANRGFTLIEVLVSLALSVMVAGIAYMFFDRALAVDEASRGILDDVSRLETVWQIMATDVHHVVDRQLPATSTAIGGSSSAPTFLGGDPTLSGTSFLQGEYFLRMVRDGWANPLRQQRSDLQRVGYRWQDGQLWRDYWAERNQPYDSEPTGRRLLAEGVETFDIKFLSAEAKTLNNATWLNSWPANASNSNSGQAQGLPAAIEVTIAMGGLGDVSRIFAIPEGVK
ncbi:GspJ family T2SS minor pseudopilin variant LspJ [Aurantivibrio plasticivorans]